MVLSQARAVVGDPCPYLGLRPFFEQDAKWYFGREEQTDNLLRMLERKRFLAVTGTSGSGKSSLVRAGLIPSLKRGYMPGSTARWRVAVARPRGDPFGELEAALADSEALGPEPGRGEMLRRSSKGLVQSAAESLSAGDSLLLVIDQFEEIFRFKDESDRTGDESDAFIKLLLAAADQVETAIYVVLTMRSDYLGDCSIFQGLPEALNGSQYLTPVLSRPQLREAIERPARARGVEIAPDLAQRLLNDVGHGLEQELDQLPVLQHALTRTWEKARGDEGLEMSHYAAAGRMAGALDQHADDLYAELNPRRQAIARKMFQRLTEKESQGRDIRRATRFGELTRAAGAEPSETIAVIEHFRPFLAADKASEIDGDSIVDITHEALIRQWKKLRDWARAEAETARIYRRLADDANQESPDPWRGGRLSFALALKKEEGWNKHWASRYEEKGGDGAEYGRVEAFLARSVAAKKKRGLVWAAAIAAVVLASAAGYAYYVTWNAEKAKLIAEVNAQKTAREGEQTKNLQEINRLLASVQDFQKQIEDARKTGNTDLARALAQQQGKLQGQLAEREGDRDRYELEIDKLTQQLTAARDAAANASMADKQLQAAKADIQTLSETNARLRNQLNDALSTTASSYAQPPVQVELVSIRSIGGGDWKGGDNRWTTLIRIGEGQANWISPDARRSDCGLCTRLGVETEHYTRENPPDGYLSPVVVELDPRRGEKAPVHAISFRSADPTVVAEGRSMLNLLDPQTQIVRLETPSDPRQGQFELKFRVRSAAGGAKTAR